MRSAIAAVVAAAIAAYTVHRLAYVPMYCNRVKVDVSTRTAYAFKHAMPNDTGVIGRENLDRLAFCRERSFPDVELHVLAAANYDLVRNHDQAIAEYRRALTLDERPEIYAQLGDSLMAAGRQPEATVAYTRAAAFSSFYLDWISSPVIADDVRRAVAARESLLRRR